MRLSGTKTGAVNQYRGLGNQLWDLAGSRPSLDLPFSDTQSLVDTTTGKTLVDHTRASSGTYVGSDGLIKTATTNLLLRSEEFDHAAWTPNSLVTSVTPNNTTAPDGTLTADLIASLSAPADQCVQTVAVESGKIYTISGYIKPNTSTLTRLGIFQSPATWVGAVDIFWTAGVPSTSVTLGSPSNITYTPVGNGWYRCSLTATAISTSHQIHFHPDRNNTQGSAWFWGAQLEQSSTVGEYVKTTSTINSAPRFDHDPTTGESLGLLVEESRTNYLINSESFAGWTVAANGLTQSTASAIAAPNGQSGTVQLFTEDTTNGVHRIFYFPPTGQATHAHSIFVKNASGTRFVYLSSDGPTGIRRSIKFDLESGTSASNDGDWNNVFITPYPNGWYHIGGTITDNGSTTLFIIGLDNQVASFYQGDGTSGIYIWGAQLEAGSFPTSYIPTTTSAVTRAADVASISGTNFSSWYRQDEGTVFADVTGYMNDALAGQRTVASTTDGTYSNNFAISKSSGGNTWRVDGFSGGGGVQATFTSPYAAGVPSRIAFGYALNNANASFNGSVNATDTSVNPPVSPNRLEFRDPTGASAGHPTVTIKRFTFWPTRLSNETLQTITN